MPVVDSSPYPWPYHGAVRPAQTALVLCGDVPAPDDDEPSATIGTFAEAMRAAGVVVVHSVRAGATPVTPVAAGDLVVGRPGYGAFSGTDFDLVLRCAGRTDLLFAGLPLELGADSTMREANDLGYECLLVRDCCGGLSDSTFRGAVQSIQMSGGIFGAVATAADVVAAFSQLKEVK